MHRHDRQRGAGPVRRRRGRRLGMQALVAITFAFAGLSFGVPSAGAGGTYYVATNGSDTASGSATQPWRTLQRAANAAPAGSTIYVRAGTYVGVTITRSGLTFANATGQTAYVAGDSNHKNVIRISNAHDVVIRGLIVKNAPAKWGAGIKVDSSSYRITIEGVVVANNKSFGILVEDSTAVTIKGSDIRGNEIGIQFSRAGEGSLITHNKIHDNNKMLVNDSTPNNDRGANAMAFYKTTGTITASWNAIWGHRAVSTDYGYDGGAFEIYAARNVVMTQNSMSNNQSVLETGTDGSSGCSNLTFTRNRANGGADGGRPSEGLILRCASDSLIANNTFYDLSRFVFYITGGGAFAGGIENLTIRNNLSRQTGAQIYSLGSGIPSTLTIDHDLVWNTTGAPVAWISGKGNTKSLETFSYLTGHDRHGLQMDPKLDLSTWQSTLPSPVVDHGTVISGHTDGFLGLAPDIGRYELR
jgi:parallel beta-helix repeat protein